ncbi:MAG TPA: hypothetical protein VF447_16505 [Terriglobales bacterium]
MKRRVTVVAAGLLIVAGVASGMLLRAVDHVRTRATLQEVLYVPSPKILKRASLGYDGLLADIYWTRAVQYYGANHYRGVGEYHLLWPLLDITTQLDPHLIPAYLFGSTFLAAQPPFGAGLPHRAIQLVEYGIKNNPDDWHLYYDLGYLHYDLKDYRGAADAFERGSKVPHAHPFLKILAAQSAEHGGEPRTAQLLWRSVLETTHDKYIRPNAIWHLRALQADQDSKDLEQVLNTYRERTGHFPANFEELVRAGWLRSLPVDPRGEEYQMDSDGHVFIADPENFPFVTSALPPGYVPSSFPRIPPTD